MENFDWTSFTLRIAIKADRQAIYKAWATKEIEKWFLSEADYLAADNQPIDATQLATVGNRYVWRWFLYEDMEKGEVTQADGKTFFEFTFAGSCLVNITLTEENEYTVVTLTQKNIPTDDNSKKYIRLGCHGGWSFYLVNLKSVYEGGLDLRNKDNRFKPMLNN
ncbi:SRPBCC domain-containing protein [Pedobacter sp. KR3-3]|uniref:SRPBCC domain-containing protein n=1 Tax=Pedobacter albus TaxID=3113905 RepID=A0ABU7I269_9SPHI|nr:SRPBCC domain-containing protein [Pedobacter sp. KR3-3]MEE1943545.1 SRPBCC domain-containing protein [Pedobacter sp. KR3-3]